VPPPDPQVGQYRPGGGGRGGHDPALPAIAGALERHHPEERLLDQVRGQVARLHHRSTFGRILIAGSLTLLGTLGVPAASASAAAQSGPVISSVSFSGSVGDYTVTIKGSGLGTLRGTLPVTGTLPYLCILDNAQVGHGTYGCGDNSLTFEHWTPTRITVGGYAGQPGDAVQIAIWSPQSTGEVAWAGKVPGGPAGPVISTVTVFGSGGSLKFTISGTGFGKAPVKMPDTGNLNFLRFTDWGQLECAGSPGLFEAGFAGWGINPTDTVTVKYASWTSTQIVIDGFSGSYGSECNVALSGDPVTIGIYASSDTSDTGPQTAWAGVAT
jgi:hypothetical protein